MLSVTLENFDWCDETVSYICSSLEVRVVFVFAYLNVIWLTHVLCISRAVNRIGGLSNKSSRWSIFLTHFIFRYGENYWPYKLTKLSQPCLFISIHAQFLIQLYALILSIHLLMFWLAGVYSVLYTNVTGYPLETFLLVKSCFLYFPQISNIIFDFWKWKNVKH